MASGETIEHSASFVSVSDETHERTREPFGLRFSDSQIGVSDCEQSHFYYAFHYSFFLEQSRSFLSEQCGSHGTLNI